jgi:putative two-component system response regulator
MHLLGPPPAAQQEGNQTRTADPKAFLLHSIGGVSLAATILIIDDDEPSARVLSHFLTGEGYRVRVVVNETEGAELCVADPPDLILLDLVARGSGIDLCQRLKTDEATRLIPVVIVTSPLDRSDRLRGIEAGADDFVTKPFDSAELRARIRSLLRLKRYTDELESAEAVILGLGATIEARDPHTRGHCLRLAQYAATLGRSINLDRGELAALHRGAFLHDIGKIAVPDRVLLKHGALDPDEARVMREHPVIGDALCSGLRTLRSVRPIVRHHHERLDGSGYPDGLKNGQVPLLAQVVSVVDVFDALTTDRPYREALPHQVAMEVLRDEAARGWRDRELVDTFASIVPL